VKSQLREELLPEASFRMSVKESELGLDFNYGTLALKYVCDARGVYAQYFDGERRLSIHNDKLMDMRRLRVVKGDEALKETKEVLSSAESLVNEGITEAQTFFSVDLSLVRRAYSAIAANVKVDPRAFLDIKVSQVSIDVNREFRRDVPWSGFGQEDDGQSRSGRRERAFDGQSPGGRKEGVLRQRRRGSRDLP